MTPFETQNVERTIIGVRHLKMSPNCLDNGRLATVFSLTESSNGFGNHSSNTMYSEQQIVDPFDSLRLSSDLNHMTGSPALANRRPNVQPMPFGWPFHTQSVNRTESYDSREGAGNAIEVNNMAYRSNADMVVDGRVPALNTALSTIIEEVSILEERSIHEVMDDGVYSYNELNNSRHAQE